MPKATLTFNLPEEQREHELATKAGALHQVLWDLDQDLRSKIKHGDYPEAVRAAYQEVRSKLHELVNEENIPWD
jgi:hypothetical protein